LVVRDQALKREQAEVDEVVMRHAQLAVKPMVELEREPLLAALHGSKAWKAVV
jgi:hypothetical protein